MDNKQSNGAKCKYCGRKISANSIMCYACKEKLVLVRKFIEVCKQIKAAEKGWRKVERNGRNKHN